MPVVHHPTRGRKRLLTIISAASILLIPIVFWMGTMGGEDPNSSNKHTLPSYTSAIKSSTVVNTKPQLFDFEQPFTVLSSDQQALFRPPTGDLRMIARTGQRIFVAQTIKQIHHGVYKVEALALPSTTSSSSRSGGGRGDGNLNKAKMLRFAFKTECRPAAKWHGQQGWGEVAAHRLLQMMNQHSVSQTKDFDFSASFRIDDQTRGSAHSPTEVFQNTISFSAGGILFVTPQQMREVIHKDQCGAMSDDDIKAWKATVLKVDSAIQSESVGGTPQGTLKRYGLLSGPTSNYWARFQKLMTAGSSLSESEKDGVPTIPLYGVFLTWNPNHNDDSLPKKHMAPQFSLPNKQGAGGSGSGSIPHAEDPILLKQITEILVLDYILGNEDREDKNWFKGKVEAGSVPEERLIMMDNGWVFSGRNYKESMCGLYEPLLLCPPLLRYLTGSSKCKVSSKHDKKLASEPLTAESSAALSSLSSTSTEMQVYLREAPYAMCRFPKHLIEQLLRFLSAWIGGAAAQDRDLNGILPLSLGSPTTRAAIRELMEKYTLTKMNTEKDISKEGKEAPLSEFWVSLVKNDLLVAQLLSAYASKSTETFNFPLSRHSGSPCKNDEQMRTAGGPIEQIAVSIGRRMARVIRAAVDCVEAFGEPYVLLL